jgi:DNA-binding MarR family transcriptional regulator
MSAEMEPSDAPIRRRVADTPPSAKLVFYVLEKEGPATPSQLACETRLPARTVRSALDTLLEIDLVERRRYVQDARKNVYHARNLR